MKIKNCRICNDVNLIEILDYGNVALADAFIDESEIGNEKKFPLKLCICGNCKHVQIDEIIDPKDLFEYYVWESSVSSSIVQYAEELYDNLISRFCGRNPNVLEIASNDGSILKVFKDNGCQVLGVDPAKNIVEIANSKGVESIARFFNWETAVEVVEKFGKKDIVIARNVIAHVSDLHGLVLGLRHVLKEDGYACIEFPQLKTTFSELQYDQVFHEHIGFHSLDSIKRLFEGINMEIFDAEEVWIHGGSLRVFIQHQGGPNKVVINVQNLLNEEIELGLFEESSWVRFAQRVLEHKEALRSELTKLKDDGKKVIIYGASGKGQALLQFCNIDNTMIDSVIDKSKLKQGKITPGTHIKVYSPERIYECNADVILLCAWNFAREIMLQEEKFMEKGGLFLHPIPMPHYLNK